MATVVQEVEWVHPSNGRRLFTRFWKPVEPYALLVLIHGFGEHGGRYDHLAEELAERGIAVGCADLWGHGRSAGARGDIHQLDQLIADLKTLAQTVWLPQVGGRRFAIFGHSFGGLLAIRWLLQDAAEISCAIIQSPLLDVGFAVPVWKQSVADLLAKAWPTLTLSNSLDPTGISHDPNEVHAYRIDPLVHAKISVRCYQALKVAMAEARASAARIQRPVLFLYGGADRVVSVAACDAFAQGLTGECRIQKFPDAYHELHHESIYQKIIEETAQWVRSHA